MAVADTAVQTQPTRRAPTPPGAGLRTLLGIAGAGAALALLTAALHNLPHGLSMLSQILCYLIVVAVTAAVSNFYAAGLAALGATLLVDYFITPPQYEIAPGPDNLIFLAAALAISALSAAWSTGIRRRVSDDVAAVVDEALRTTAGAQRWAAVYATHDGEEYAIHAPHVDPLTAAQLCADAAHSLTCPGCERCELQVAA
jgi:K+-sensing histidine kinase KdpD